MFYMPSLPIFGGIKKLTIISIILMLLFMPALFVSAQSDLSKEQESLLQLADELSKKYETISKSVSKDSSLLSSQEMERFERISMMLTRAKRLAEEGNIRQAREILNQVERGLMGIEGRTADAPEEHKTEKDKKKLFTDFNWEALGVILVPIGAFAAWIIARRKRRSISKYLTEIDDCFSHYKMKSKRCEAELYRLRDMISEELKKGSIDENAYSVLDKRIDEYLKELREHELNDKFGGMPNKLKNELNKLLEDGEISENDYEKFQGLISKSSGMEENEKEALDSLMKKWRDKDSK